MKISPYQKSLGCEFSEMMIYLWYYFNVFTPQAYDQPDVYETSDLPEVDQSENLYDEDPENECIERLHISAKDAFSKFRGKYLTGNVDFSDRLSKRIRTGYDARSGEWELAAEGEKETPFQKFHRLQCETRELFEELTVLQQNEKDVNKVNIKLDKENVSKDNCGILILAYSLFLVPNISWVFVSFKKIFFYYFQRELMKTWSPTLQLLKN